MESYHLYLLSNATNHLNVNNSLSNFICTLPEVLNLSTQHQWGARIESISFQSKISKEARTPKFVKVLLDQVKPHPTSTGYEKDILTSTIEKKSNATTFYHEPHQRTFFLLNRSDINYLSIKLVDDRNEQLKLLPSQATVVQLHIAKMDSSIIPLSIVSNASDKLFPSNTNTGNLSSHSSGH